MTGPAAEEAEAPWCLGRCGNRLTSEKSVTRGYGPRCWRKLHGRPVRRPRRTTPTAQPGPGQPELPYDDQLPLWNPK